MSAHFIDSEMSVAISLDAVRHVMGRCPCFKNLTGIPTERQQVEVDFSKTEHFYEDLESEVTGIPPVMVFNLDETGHQGWADRKDIKVVVPVSYEGNSIHMPCGGSPK
jgi:hypothetical protein